MCNSGSVGGTGSRAFTTFTKDTSHLGPGELSEIEGIGPISIASARDLVGDSVLKLLVTSSNDVHSVFNMGRYIPAKVSTRRC